MKATTKLFLTASNVICLSISGFAADLTVDGSLIVGDGWANGTNSVSIGHTAVSGANSMACGTYVSASGDYSLIIGAGGDVSGMASAVIGSSIWASGDYSMALGMGAGAVHDNTFIWSDGDAGWGGYVQTTAEKQFNVYALNGIHLNTGTNADLTINGESVARLSDLSNIVQVYSSTVSTQDHGYVWQDVPGLSVTIDPLSANSEVLIKANVACAITSGGTYLRIAKSDGTTLGSGRGLASVSYHYVHDCVIGGTPASMMFLDSPATDQPVTYTVQAKAMFGTATFNEYIDSVLIAEEKVK